MTVRDLGYRAYDGTRIHASRNTWVLLRHALRRAWGSWLVKLAVFLSWVPMIGPLLKIGGAYWVQSKLNGHAPPAEVAQLLATLTNGNELVRGMIGNAMWWLVMPVTLGAGASCISEDMSQRAFQFYLAKPVTIRQYLIARTGAAAILSFAVVFVPMLLVLVFLTAASDPSHRLAQFGLILPAILHITLLVLVLSAASVATSSLSKSRALTMTVWIVIVLVPQTIAALVSEIANVSWLYLGSVPEMLSLIGDALFKTVDTERLVRWYHAAPIVALVAVGSAWLAHRRVQNAEVVA